MINEKDFVVKVVTEAFEEGSPLDFNEIEANLDQNIFTDEESRKAEARAIFSVTMVSKLVPKMFEAYGLVIDESRIDELIYDPEVRDKALRLVGSVIDTFEIYYDKIVIGEKQDEDPEKEDEE